MASNVFNCLFVSLEAISSHKGTSPEYVNVQCRLLVLLLKVLIELAHSINLFIHGLHVIIKPLLLDFLLILVSHVNEELNVIPDIMLKTYMVNILFAQ